MEHVSIDEVDPAAMGADIDRRGLSDPLSTTDLSVNHYRLTPGERLSGSLHAHTDQEEVFVVIEGEATFERLDDDDVTVGAGEAVRFGPGEYQSGVNDGDGELRVLGLGAPRDSEDVRLPAACPDCEHGNLRIDTDDGLTFVCPDCGESFVPDGCPDCGAPAMQMTLDAEQSGDDPDPVAACQECGATFPEPPLSD
ncbi:cupin [Halobacteriales archaeon SW_12_71_31]|nr:MAG: cupin [Halobacteriales archaeon SW_12_71_31]